MNTTLDPSAINRIIEALLAQLHTAYVYPEVAGEMARAVRARHAAGAYAHVVDQPALCEVLTTDLQAISGDRHLFVRVREAADHQARLIAAPKSPLPDPCAADALLNFGVARVERLPGNVGLLDLRAFYPPDCAAPILAAAMTLLSHTGALLIDLRQNTGGYAATVALLASYFFEPPARQLSSVFWRAEARTDEAWTSAEVVGSRYAHKPLYLLTSAVTFSAAEAFTYDLQHYGRAIIVGERTRGGAHLPRGFVLDEQIEVAIPCGRAINPVTRSDWEGSGVLPNVPVTAAHALQVAYRAALDPIVAALRQDGSTTNEHLLAEAEEALAALAV